MAEGMPRHGEHLERDAEHRRRVAVVQRHIAPRNGFVGRAMDAGAGDLLELLHATDVVVVVVGNEDVGERPVAMRLQPRQHRCGVAGVDHRAVAFGSIL